MVRSRDPDPFAMLVSSVVLCVFCPLCEVGENLLTAKQAVCGYVYRGPWLEASLPLRRNLLLLMKSSAGRGGVFRCRGIGTLHRRYFFLTIRAWFNFLQALVNLS
ncbi:hypothetical protein ONE63_011582 [Megalurothrips usitatus]|uniref:Secreted protein n=1 Tax=Megalurothrips usitatus TaxID=439358 RepID=A0AAV7X2F9_9NEOP|nr:hypothetical protein ONE63_011582 [Megalurothrips usitatus]